MTLLETPLLQTDGLTRRFAGLTAVDQVDLSVTEGTIHAVIGPNGAGKTTLFNLISGLVPPSDGSMRFAGQDITRQPVHHRAGLGMARTFQNIRIFASMTVLENVLTGLHARLDAGMGSVVLRLPRFRRSERAAVARARDVLEMVGLADKAEHRAAALAYGDQRRLEIARALASKPRLLLLDEPAAGMNPAETDALKLLVRRIRDAGTTVLLVEHDMGFVMDLSDRITVLNFGRRIFEGSPIEVRQETTVIEAYLGHKVAARLAQRVAG
jgi:branched-chain amino acid transport system ATP-binding protein